MSNTQPSGQRAATAGPATRPDDPAAASTAPSADEQFPVIGSRFVLNGVRWTGRIIASSQAIYLLQEHPPTPRSVTLTGVVVGAAGIFLGRVLGDFIASAAGESPGWMMDAKTALSIAGGVGGFLGGLLGLVAGRSLARALVRPPESPRTCTCETLDDEVRLHRHWPIKHRSCIPVVIIPRDGVAALRHSRFSNVINCEFDGLRISMEYPVSESATVVNILRAGGWPLIWPGQ